MGIIVQLFTLMFRLMYYMIKWTVQLMFLPLRILPKLFR